MCRRDKRNWIDSLALEAEPATQKTTSKHCDAFHAKLTVKVVEPHV